MSCRRIGHWRYWHKNGSLESEGEHDGCKIRLWRYWDKDGILKFETEHSVEYNKKYIQHDDFFDDDDNPYSWHIRIEKCYHKNKKLKHVGKYRDNHKIGLWKYYDDDGRIES